MVSAPDPARIVTKTRRPCGKPDIVTPEIVVRIAKRVANGHPLRFALALDTALLTMQGWNEALQRRTVLARLFDKEIAVALDAFLGQMRDPETKLRTMPASVWIWERRWPEYFAPPKAGGNTTTNITNNVLVLQDDVRKRVAAMVAVKRVKRLAPAQDVEPAPGKVGKHAASSKPGVVPGGPVVDVQAQVVPASVAPSVPSGPPAPGSPDVKPV